MGSIEEYRKKIAPKKELDIEAKVDSIVSKQEPVPETETPKKTSKLKLTLSPKEKDDIEKQYIGRQKKVNRRERKMIASRERDRTAQTQNTVMYFAVICMAFIWMAVYILDTEWATAILLYVGLLLFMPIGMVAGWMFLDPYMRCKMLRRVTHKNYGIINFVGKGQKVSMKIKNFDDSLIWKDNAVWAVTKEHIYQVNKTGEHIVDDKGEIRPESIITMVETVPMLFVDLDSMQPLSLTRDRSEGINPLELGSALKSWIDNEKAKTIGLRKNLDMFLVIVAILALVACFMSYLCLVEIYEVRADIEVLRGLIRGLQP